MATVVTGIKSITYLHFNQLYRSIFDRCIGRFDYFNCGHRSNLPVLLELQQFAAVGDKKYIFSTICKYQQPICKCQQLDYGSRVHERNFIRKQHNKQCLHHPWRNWCLQYHIFRTCWYHCCNVCNNFGSAAAPVLFSHLHFISWAYNLWVHKKPSTKHT